MSEVDERRRTVLVLVLIGGQALAVAALLDGLHLATAVAGTTAARGATRRQGLEVAARVRVLDWLAFTGDFTHTSRARGSSEGNLRSSE